MAKYSGGIKAWWAKRKIETGRTDFGGVDYYDWLKENAPEDGSGSDKRWGDPDISDLVWARKQVLNHLDQSEFWETNKKGNPDGLYEKINSGDIQSWWTAKRGQEGIAERNKFNEADYLAAMATGKSSWEVRNWLGQHLQVENAQTVFDALTKNRKANINKLYEDLLGRKGDPEGVQQKLDSGHSLNDIKATIENSTEYKKKQSGGTTTPEFPETTTLPIPPDPPTTTTPTTTTSTSPDINATWKKSQAVTNYNTKPFLTWWKKSSGLDGNDFVNKEGKGLHDFGGADYRNWMQYAVDNQYGVKKAREHVAEFLKDNPGALHGPNRANWEGTKHNTAKGFNLEELINAKGKARHIGPWVGGPYDDEKTTFSHIDFYHARSLGYTDQEVLNWLSHPDRSALKNTTEGTKIYDHLVDLAPNPPMWDSDGNKTTTTTKPTTPATTTTTSKNPGNPSVAGDKAKAKSYYYKRAYNEFKGNKHWDWDELSDSEVQYVDQKINETGLKEGWAETDAGTPLGMNSEARLKALYAAHKMKYVLPSLEPGDPGVFGSADYIYALNNPPTHDNGEKWSKKEVRDFIIKWLGSPEGKKRTPNWGDLKEKIEANTLNKIGTWFGDYANDTLAGTRFTDHDYAAMQAAGFYNFEIKAWLDKKGDAWLENPNKITASLYDKVSTAADYPGFDATVEEKARSPLYRVLARVLDHNDNNWSGGKPRVFNGAWYKLTGPTGKTEASKYKPGTGQSDRKDIVEEIDQWAKNSGLAGVTSWRMVKTMLQQEGANVAGKKWKGVAWDAATAKEKGWTWKNGADRVMGEGIFIPKGEADGVGAFHIPEIPQEDSGYLNYEIGDYWSKSKEGDPMAGGQLITDLPGDEDINKIDLSDIQKISLKGLIGHELEDDPSEAEAVIENYENWFLDRMFKTTKDEDGKNLAPLVDEAADEWGLDIMRTYKDKDGNVVTLSGKDLIDFDADDNIYNVNVEMAEHLMKGDIDWAFYNESPAYAAAKKFAGIEGHYDTVSEIRRANVYVAAAAQGGGESATDWVPYKKQFKYFTKPGETEKTGQIWNKSEGKWEDAVQVTDAKIGVAKNKIKERYPNIKVPDIKSKPDEIAKPTDMLKGGEIKASDFQKDGKYAATWGDTSKWKSGTVDLIKGKKLIKKPGSFKEI